MTKNELNKYIGKTVVITFIDEEVLVGTLRHGMGLGLNKYNDDKNYYRIPEHMLTFSEYQVKNIEEK